MADWRKLIERVKQLVEDLKARGRFTPHVAKYEAAAKAAIARRVEGAAKAALDGLEAEVSAGRATVERSREVGQRVRQSTARPTRTPKLDLARSIEEMYAQGRSADEVAQALVARGVSPAEVELAYPSLAGLMEVYGARAAEPGARALYQKAIAADDALSAELRRVYGAAAGEARYDVRARATPRLRQLVEAKQAADNAYLTVTGRGTQESMLPTVPYVPAPSAPFIGPPAPTLPGFIGGEVLPGWRESGPSAWTLDWRSPNQEGYITVSRYVGEPYKVRVRTSTGAIIAEGEATSVQDAMHKGEDALLRQIPGAVNVVQPSAPAVVAPPAPLSPEQLIQQGRGPHVYGESLKPEPGQVKIGGEWYWPEDAQRQFGPGWKGQVQATKIGVAPRAAAPGGIGDAAAAELYAKAVGERGYVVRSYGTVTPAADLPLDVVMRRLEAGRWFKEAGRLFIF